MKKLILTIALAAAAVLGINASGYAATGSTQEVTTLTQVSQISKIEIHGNVQLYVSDGTADQVKVYNKYYAENAMVQDQNGVLRISSYNGEKLVVWVTVTNLTKLSVYDDSEVQSFGKLSAIDLDMRLYNNASAKLNIDAYQASLTLADHAKADLGGDVTESYIRYDRSSSVNITNFTASHLVKKVNPDATEFASL